MRIRFLGHYLHLPVMTLAAAETLAFCLAMYGALTLPWGGPAVAAEQTPGLLLTHVLVYAGVLDLCYFALGLFTSRQRAVASGLALRMFIAVTATVLISAVIYALLPDVDIGWPSLLLAAVASLLLSAVARIVAWRMVDVEGIKKRVLLYGSSAQMSVFNRMRRRNDRAGFHVVGVVRPPGGNLDLLDTLNERILEAPYGLKALCEEEDVDELVVAMQDRRQGLPVKELLQCRLAGVGVIEFISFMERETGRIQLDLLNPSWMTFGEGFRRDGVRLFTARALDFIASGLLLVLASPVILLTMLAIWLEDGRKGGGVFYRQMRVGHEGAVFPLIKFRSMRADAEAAGAQWAQKNDPRVTRVGAFIRKTRIDELPQLLNVLRGHMSFVGPRPERPEFVIELESKIPFYAYRHSVKPGITGWAQLCYPYGSSVEDAAQKLQYDLYYVKNHNLLFDISILLQTVEVVVMGKGAR
jgi:sugar transferase (PEP-CTERM system associated)